MKKLLLSAFVICLAGTSIAQESPLWMRHCALSPDGTTIAFTYKGDIYTVPSTGGRATQITTNPAFDTEPVWSPDSKQIAFASDRMGSLDVFVVSSEGGTRINADLCGLKKIQFNLSFNLRKSALIRVEIEINNKLNNITWDLMNF